jgi:spermidine synthase
MSGSVFACIAAILSIGASGMVAQVTLLRELLAQFAGSELYIGLIIGNWIAAEALGAFVAGRFMKDPSRSFPRYIRLSILFSLLFPAIIFLARTWRAATTLPFHESISLFQILPASIILLLPLAIIQGGQFVLAVSMYADLTGKVSESPGKVYGFETIGTVIGGTVASFFLIPLLSPFQTAWILLMVNGLICIFLWKATPLTMNRTGLLLHLLPLMAATALCFGGSSILDRFSLKLQWSGDTLAEAGNTPYQNLAVIRSGEQYTFYGDGTPIISLPDPDIEKIEETAGIPLLAHPFPGRVLVLGGGAVGVIGEILKHPSVVRIDYVELDPELLQTIEKYAPEPLLKDLHDPRVHIVSRDGRAFLRDTAAVYDVVLIGAPLPLNLQGNRYYSVEFFAAVKRAMKPGGVAAVGTTGSMSYYGDDLKGVTRSLIATIRQIFPHLLIIPGDRNLFIASAVLPVEKMTAAELSRRIEARQLKTALLSAPHLEWLLSDTPLQWFRQNIGEVGVVNRDFSPYLLTRHLSYTATRLDPKMKPLLEMLGKVRGYHVAAVITLAAITIAFLSRRRPRIAVTWTIATTGFSAMLLELSFFFVFQLFKGVMLKTIGFLIAIFMAGLWLGSRITSNPPRAPGHDMKRLFAGEFILLLLCGSLWMVSSGSFPTEFLHMILLPLIFLAGFSAGVQFPPAARLTSDSSGSGTALVYGFDLLGGWLGAVFGSALFLPLLGFSTTALLLMILKGSSTLCLYLQNKRVRI